MTASRPSTSPPSVGRPARTTSVLPVRNRCRSCWTPQASCTLRCSHRSGWSWPHLPCGAADWPPCPRSCWTSCAGAAPFPPRKPPASSASAPPATRRPRWMTSSSSGGCAGTSPTATPISTRRSSRTSSTAASWLRRTGKRRAPGWPLRLPTAPVDNQHLAVHVARGIGDQEDHRSRDLVRNPDPAHRVGAEHPIHDRLVAPQPLREAGLDKPRSHGVDANLAAKLASELTCEHDHAGLGDVVDAQPEARPESADARHVDDRAAVLLHRGRVHE